MKVTFAMIVKRSIFQKRMLIGNSKQGMAFHHSLFCFIAINFTLAILTWLAVLPGCGQVSQFPVQEIRLVKTGICNASITKADIEVSFEILEKTIDVQAKLWYAGGQRTDTVLFFLDRRFFIDRITDIENNSLNIRRRGDTVVVRMDRSVGKEHNDSAGLLIRYHGKPKISKMMPWESGFAWTSDTASEFFIGVTGQLAAVSPWLPVCNSWSPKPGSVTLSLVVPDTLLAISNGVLAARYPVGSGKTKYTWNSVYPLALNNLSFYIGKYDSYSDNIITNRDTIRIEYFIRRKNTELARIHFGQVHRIMEVYANRFGKFPFTETGEKIIETPYPGMEHQTAIAYGNRFMNGYMGFRTEPFDFPFDYVLIHELAHEWWGNSVSAQSMDHMWINESLATYAESLVVEQYVGKTEAADYITRDLKYSLINRNPLCDTVNGSVYSSDMYTKGSAVWHTFRNMIHNDSLFFGLLKGVQRDFKFGSISSRDLIHYVNDYVKMDYSWFFNRYIFSSSIPVLEIIPHCSDHGSIQYRWKSGSAEFPLALEIDPGSGPFTLMPDHSLQRTTIDIQLPEFREQVRRKYLVTIKILPCMNF